MAGQKSTSNPVHLPLSSGLEKPGRPWLTPQMSEPRSLTALRVCAFGAVAGQPTAIKTERKIARFMDQLPRRCFQPGCVLRHLRTIGHQGQGVDAPAAAGSSRRCGRACPRSAATGTLREPAIMKNTEHNLSRRSINPATRLVLGGRDPFANHGFVNPPVHHVSTVLYPTAEDFLARRARYLYGRRGTPTSEALEDALRALEGSDCAGVALLPSGLAAISTALLAVLHARDHLLVTDSAYQPTRRFCDNLLRRYGIATTYYDPLIGGDIAALMAPNTRAVFVEAPGSLSFEIQDVPAIAPAAHAKGAVVLMDNTWATPLYFPALERGVDLSIPSGT